MSDPKVFGIDQYAVWTHDLNGPINPLGSLASSEDESTKIVVTYADHVEALRQATALATPETVMQANYWYEQGQRDERERKVGYYSQRCLNCDHIRSQHALTAGGCIGHALFGRPGAYCPCSEFEGDQP
jgi:hypothetical protein